MASAPRWLVIGTASLVLGACSDGTNVRSLAGEGPNGSRIAPRATASVAATATPRAIDADLTGDGFVGFADLASFRQRLGSNHPAADLNEDGIVDFADLALFRLAFGQRVDADPLFTIATDDLLVADAVRTAVAVDWQQAIGLAAGDLDLEAQIVVDGDHGRFTLDGDRLVYTPEAFARAAQDTAVLRISDPLHRFRDVTVRVRDVDAEPAVAHVFVEMAEQDLDLLYSRSIFSEDPLPGIVRFRPDEPGRPAELTFRGTSTRREPKKPFNIEFEDREAFVFGGDRIIGRSMWGDPSFVREWLAYWLFDQYDIPSSRTKYYLFFLNDVFEGLYLHVERVEDKNFLEARGLNPDGTLVRDEFRSNQDDPCVRAVSVFGPNDFASRDREAALACIEDNFDSEEADWDEVLDLVLWVERSTPGPRFARELAERVDVDAMMRFLGAHILLGDYDSLPHEDYWWYKDHEDPDARWIFIPWDKDLTLGSRHRSRADDPDGTGQITGNLFFPTDYVLTVGLGGNRLFRNFMETPSLRAALEDWLLEQIDSDTWLEDFNARLVAGLLQTAPYSAARGIYPREFEKNLENRLDLYGTYVELVEQVTEYRDLRRHRLRALVQGFSGAEDEVLKTLDEVHPAGEILWLVDGVGLTLGRFVPRHDLPAGTRITLRAVPGSPLDPIDRDWELTSSVPLEGRLSLYYRNNLGANWYTGGDKSIGQQPWIQLVSETPWVTLGETDARPAVDRLDADVVIDARNAPAVFSTTFSF